MMHRASADAHPAALATATDATAVADVDYSRPTESLQVLTGVRGRRRFASRRRRRERTCGGGEDDSVVCEDGVEKLIRRKTTTMEAMAMQGRIREVGPAATVAAYFGFVRVPRRPLRMVRIGRRAPPLWTAWTIRIKSLPARPPLLLMLALLLIITTTQAVVASSLDEERSSSQYPAAAGIASPPLPRLRSLAVVDDDLVEDNILAANHVLPRIASTGNDDYDCPPLPTNKERCATVTGWAKLAEMVAAAQYLPGRRSKNNKNDKNVTNADEAADDGDDPFVPNSGRLVLCPFSIPKLSSAKSIPITGSLSLLCVDENGKTNKKGGGGEEYEPSCVISGGGTHLQIRGRNADAVDVVGFRFGGATKNSIRIGNGGAVKKALEADAAKGEGEGGGIDDGGTAPGPAPKAEQSAGAASSSAASTTRGSNAGLVRICSSTFGRNRYRGKKRSQGGAVRLGPNTRLYVSSSSFRYNSARQGGALYNYGMELVVSDCSFSRNQANKGGAIRSASGSDLTVSDSVFEFNGSKGEGISVSSKQHEKGATSASEDRTVNADTKERQGEWFDAGGNTGRGNGECNGYTEEGPGKFDYCYEFPPAKGKKNKGQGAAGGAIEGIPLTSEPTSRPTRKPTPQPTNKPTVPPEITSEKSSYRYDEDVVLTIRNAKLGPSNWVGLAKRGSGQGGKLPQGVVGRNWKLVCEGSAQQTCKKRNVFSETIEPGLYQGYLLADNVHPYSILASTDPFEVEDPPFQSFRPGKLTVKDQETGLSLSEGLQVRLIGKVGYRLKFDSLEARQGESSMGLHATPDGAGIVRDGSGWIYVSNSEQNDGKGGVYTVHFDGQGRIKDYKQRLGGTTRNCAGGIMPWGSWVSCEEYAGGQCWQVDPKGYRSPARTRLVESHGGNFESVAVDDSDPKNICFFTTEDHEYGALRRFCPSPAYVNRGWDMLHNDGRLDYLEILDGGRFTWTSSLSRGRETANDYFPYSEGVDYHNGKLYLVVKKIKALLVLDLARRTYRKESTASGLMNGGEFYNDPDQAISFGDYLYLTEDGGRSPGVYSRETSTGNYYTIFEPWDQGRFENDETSGLAFSPDNKHMYCMMQRRGYFMDFTRKDGQPFHGGTMMLKYHSMHKPGTVFSEGDVE